jgi:5-methylthioribose kinase
MNEQAHTRAVILDIEGTTSSLSFVKDELFPYARARLADYVREHAHALPNLFADVAGIEGKTSLDTPQLIATLQRWIDEDRKLTPLKSLQGLIWEEGFARGELHGHIYADAVAALRAWHGAGLKLYIYSSGSILAQKLIFSHTEYGDLTPWFSGYFDTTIGGKLEPESYTAIASQSGLPPSSLLFLSDHAGEISAAASAGLQVVLVSRTAQSDGSRDQTQVSSFAQLAPQRPTGYRTLAPNSVMDYLATHASLAARLGGQREAWRTREVGDGNLNLIFIVEGPKGSLVVKQALPYVRLVGRSWPLPLSRSHFEALALAEQARWAPAFVPALYHVDPTMALVVMEHLSPHVVLRRGLVQARRYAHAAQHLGTFLAQTLFHTSDIYLGAAAKKARIGAFLDNTALCKISEDLIFDEPYFAAPLNRHTRPQLDDLSQSIRGDTALKLAVQELKASFLCEAEALLHGDLHTGSVMVTERDTRVIDPEFAFFGPMGFDVGAIIGNFLLAYVSQRGHETVSGERDAQRTYLLGLVVELWETFAHVFAGLWREHARGDLYSARLLGGTPDLQERAIAVRLQRVWNHSLGFAGCKMIRRIFGLAHVEDFESIVDADLRAGCEQRAVALARAMLVDRHAYPTVEALIAFAREHA